jgi:hypothetical protein
MSARNSTLHRNDERTVQCPVDGCDATPLARGVHLHVLRSAGGGHGEQNTIPDDVNLDNLETVGEREVEMNYPTHRSTETVARLCPYCRRPFRGGQGVMIHLGQVAGRRNHPEEAAANHDVSDFPVVHVDDDGNVTEVVEETKALPEVDFAAPDKTPAESVGDMLREAGREDIADEVEEVLGA